MEVLYGQLADWWLLISPPEDYGEEAAFYINLLSQAGAPQDASLLELGSGGGSNAFHLKHRFSPMTLTDVSAGMLEQSRALNPECEHLLGDMRLLRLNRQFDVVFIHDAIDYMVTEDDLRAAIETAFVHCKPGGLALFVPDHVHEKFEPGTSLEGRDRDGRQLRYVEWTLEAMPGASQYTVEYVFMLRQSDGPVQVLRETHICGLFEGTTWLRLLGEAGFETKVIPDDYNRDQFLARRPVKA
jgi:trans-aconitate methyltransferase